MLNVLRVPLLLGSAAAVLLLARAGPRRPAGRVGSRAPCRVHKVVVIGAGFGGLAAAQALAGRPGVELTVLDRHNHHLFQPLLYQVATAALSQDEIASPVRTLFAGKPRTRVLMEAVTGIDTAARDVVCGSRRVPYDTLIVATGSQPSYFGHDDWEAVAPGLKTLDDALVLRQRILGAFEQATLPENGPAERARLLTFVLVGGGATGVEMAGSIAELARDTISYDYGGKTGVKVRVVIVEGGPRILDGFAPDLSARAVRDLQDMGIEVRTGAKVTDIQPGAVHIGEEVIHAETIIWTAGVTSTPAASWMGVEPAKGGRVAVGPDLQVPGQPGIYVIGDAALPPAPGGKPLPGVAPVAKQQGGYVARAIRRRLRGRTRARPFGYRDPGTLATIGRNKAVAEFGPVHLTGFVAWITWAVAHIFFLIGYRNRILVSAQWLLSYVTRERGGRVIVGAAGQGRLPVRSAGQHPNNTSVTLESAATR